MNKFNSQICTSVEQSKRLLELGLKPETADCFHWNYSGVNYVGNITEGLEQDDIPAWESAQANGDIRFAIDRI